MHVVKVSGRSSQNQPSTASKISIGLTEAPLHWVSFGATPVREIKALSICSASFMQWKLLCQIRSRLNFLPGHDANVMASAREASPGWLHLFACPTMFKIQGFQTEVQSTCMLRRAPASTGCRVQISPALCCARHLRIDESVKNIWRSTI